jgi:hypothetical protein
MHPSSKNLLRVSLLYSSTNKEHISQRSLMSDHTTSECALLSSLCLSPELETLSTWFEIQGLGSGLRVDDVGPKASKVSRSLRIVVNGPGFWMLDFVPDPHSLSHLAPPHKSHGPTGYSPGLLFGVGWSTLYGLAHLPSAPDPLYPPLIGSSSFSSRTGPIALRNSRKNHGHLSVNRDKIVPLSGQISPRQWTSDS